MSKEQEFYNTIDHRRTETIEVATQIFCALSQRWKEPGYSDVGCLVEAVRFATDLIQLVETGKTP